jgi:phosphoribosyl-AMP cyclohydrolase
VSEELEQGTQALLDFRKLKKVAQVKSDVVPVVVQDVDSKEVLILAYANRIALKHSLENGTAAFWSTSRNKLWVKGLESGNSLELIEVRVNCEQNSLLYLVRRRQGGACHVKKNDGSYQTSCYYRRMIGKEIDQLEFIEEE